MKPSLVAVSGIIGQIKCYVDNIREMYHDRKRKIKIAVLTFDQTNKYDIIFEKENITVYRIPQTK
jgi:hypothetical protein